MLFSSRFSPSPRTITCIPCILCPPLRLFIHHPHSTFILFSIHTFISHHLLVIHKVHVACNGPCHDPYISSTESSLALAGAGVTHQRIGDEEGRQRRLRRIATWARSLIFQWPRCRLASSRLCAPGPISRMSRATSSSALHVTTSHQSAWCFLSSGLATESHTLIGVVNNDRRLCGASTSTQIHPCIQSV